MLATVLLAAPASAAPGDWWQFGYTAAHTRFNPNETTITQANVATLGIAAQHRPAAWRQDPGRLRRQLANRPPGDRVRGRHRLSSIGR